MRPSRLPAILVAVIVAIIRCIPEIAPYLVTVASTLWYCMVVATKKLVPPLSAVISMVLSLPALIHSNPVMAALILSSLASLTLSIFLSARAVRPEASRAVREAKGVDLAALLASQPGLRDLRDRVKGWIARDIELAGVYENPYHLAAIYVVASIVSMAVIAPLAVWLAVKANPLFASLLAVPFMPLLLPKLRLKVRIGERRSGIVDELPFFVCYGMIMQGVGKTLYDAFKGVLGLGIFRGIEREAMAVVRDVELMGYDQVEALSRLGRAHPNEKFRTLLLGYTSVLRSGGDLVRYMEVKLRDFMEDMKFRWRKYGDDATTLMEVMLMVLLIFPALMLAGAFIMPGEAIYVLNSLTTMGIPLVITLFYAIIVISQPRTYDVVRIPVIIPASLGLLVGIVLYLMGISRHVMVAAVFATFAGLNGILVQRQLGEVSAIENALPRFLRDLTEFRKIGYSLTGAIVKIAGEVSYCPEMDAHIRYVAGEVSHGRSVRDTVRRLWTRSWLERLTWHIVAVAAEEGEVRPVQLEALIDFIETVNRVKRETRARLRLQTLIAMMAPIGLALIVSMMAAVTTFFAAAFPTGQAIGQLPVMQALEEIGPLAESSRALIIASALGIGILGGKILSLTAKDTRILFVVMLATIIAMLFSDRMVEAILSRLAT